MLTVTFVGSLYKTHAILCSKIADVYGIEVHDVRTWTFVYFRKIFRFLLHITIIYPKMVKFGYKTSRQSVAN